MICQHCGYERAATQPSCPVCGSTQLSLPSQGGIPTITPSGQGAYNTPSIPARMTLSPAQRPLTMQREAATLAPGMALHGQRYLLVERREVQQWSPGVYEARWRSQDRESGKEVLIGEVTLPLSGNDLQTFFRTSTKALLRSNDLLNVFLEQGRGFFVFVALTGESLHTRIQRRGTLNERDAIACYRQLAEALQILSQRHWDDSLKAGRRGRDGNTAAVGANSTRRNHRLQPFRLSIVLSLWSHRLHRL